MSIVILHVVLYLRELLAECTLFLLLQSVAAEEKNMGPYLECTQCGKKCYGRNRKQNLAHHSITHNNERNVACKHCPYRASSSSQLMRHLSQLHPYAFNMDPMELLRNIQISRTE